ncbi:MULTISPECIES: sensor domain-containing diguanylate cyclase [Acetobacter]|uniref:diguanylate cyclase n=3 Tax=Acetobacter TaxID=434 RepID=A0A841QDN0_9PROT|nr:diguanylate cyclase [Acetobacter lovaniensis]MBB6456560.1 diguanylate cyclase (GGDEF)-like protein [Acetobacter lovaniensis]MCI1698080.1 diguanylate cyclase [Acetobacter lovaniensis]MCI1796291.1 diguanylate cyclase [Acetobacter lovaniensis]NHN80921.1 diguanylate cyclase [Acetobacter lovaniensis]GBQ62664.1 diguanylate cyclase [Acetobacter lovaniensis NRIC 0474]
MLHSLASRIIFVGFIVSVNLICLSVLLLSASNSMISSFEWNAHRQKITEVVTETLSDLREAQAEERGYLLTTDPSFAKDFDDRVASALAKVNTLEQLVQDNPIQHERAQSLQVATNERLDTLIKQIALARQGRFDEARSRVIVGQGRVNMAIIAQKADEIRQTEQELLIAREATARAHATWNRNLVVGGCLIIVLLVNGLLYFVLNGMRRSVSQITRAMSDFGNGNRTVRVDARMGCTEFDILAHGYNTMAERLDAAMQAQEASDYKLLQANAELKRNNEAMELLGEMAHRLQAARTSSELSAIICAFVPRVLPGIPGALYTYNHTTNQLERIAHWGSHTPVGRDGLHPSSCWALRLGQSHSVNSPGGDVICQHVDSDICIYHCEPLFASGEVVGLLYLQSHVAEENRFRLVALVENIASALVNQNLQKDLLEQTIHDPLTGLYNRRYMEEALNAEIATASRNNTALSLIMADIDHFKRINDEFGHDAGDMVLRTFANEIQNSFRSNDIVCRFGGEEFLIITTYHPLNSLIQRVEELRLSLSRLELYYNGQALGKITMSFGVTTWDKSLPTETTAIIRKADAALYQAKKDGRDRIVVG